jgi:hypothetical protein
MDILFSLGQLLVLAGLGFCGWRCFLEAGKYDADSLRADIATSRVARTRGHSETIVEHQGFDHSDRIATALLRSP